jgi:hypothetical protein
MDQLIEIWQTVGTDQREMDKKYRPDDLIPQIIRLQRNQRQVLRFKTYGAISILFMALIFFVSQFTLEIYSISGICIITASILGTVILLNRKRFKITDEERSLSTLSLIKRMEAKIKTERKVFTIYLPVMLLMVILGINLIYYGFLSELETKVRIIYHIVMTVSMIVAFFLGLSVRIKRFRRRFIPLLNRIKEFKNRAN